MGAVIEEIASEKIRAQAGSSADTSGWPAPQHRQTKAEHDQRGEQRGQPDGIVEERHRDVARREKVADAAVSRGEDMAIGGVYSRR